MPHPAALPRGATPLHPPTHPPPHPPTHSPTHPPIHPPTHALQVNIEVHLEPGGELAGALDAAAAGDQGWKQHQGHPQQQPKQPCPTLEEQLEASMQLCDSDSEGGEEASHGVAGVPQGQGDPLADAVAAGGSGGDPGELIWYLCLHVVKGLRQAEPA
jgi:hypothetical protein